MQVAAGNEAVLRARFQDAQFFYEEDKRSSLEAFRPALGGMLFHADLGAHLSSAAAMRLAGIQYRPHIHLTRAVSCSEPGAAC